MLALRAKGIDVDFFRNQMRLDADAHKHLALPSPKGWSGFEIGGRFARYAVSRSGRIDTVLDFYVADHINHLLAKRVRSSA